MALIRSGVDALVDSINRLNPGVNLVQTDYVYGLPTTVVDDPDNYNTSITITERNSNSAYEGSVVVRYNRRSLSDLQAILPNSIKVSELTNTTQFAELLNSTFGLSFTNDDIIEEPIGVPEAGGEITVRAKPTSVGWLGAATFYVEPGLYSIPEFVKTRDLPGFFYPGQETNRPFAGIYSYWRDFSPVSNLLEGQSSQAYNLPQLTQALISVTGNPWVHTSISTYSLDGSGVIYNGPTEGDDRFNDDYEFGLIVQLSSSCTGLSGNLIIHYGLKS